MIRCNEEESERNSLGHEYTPGTTTIFDGLGVDGFEFIGLIEDPFKHSNKLSSVMR